VPREAPLDPVELQRILQEVNPGVLLVEPRVLRRIIRRHLEIPGLGLLVPHRKSIVLARENVLPHAHAWELGVRDTENIPEQLILITRPAADRLAALSRDDALLKYWRLLFHASIHRNLESALRTGRLTASLVRERARALGQAEFNEIRQVLIQEKYLLPPGNDEPVYVEFSAVYWELRYFAPYFLAIYFPGLPGLRLVDETLSKDLDARALFLATRPDGAPDPTLLDWTEQNRRADPIPDPLPIAAEQPPEPEARAAMLRRATWARARGNLVRSAILNTRAQGRAKGTGKTALANAASDDMDRLARRLQRALGAEKGDAHRWRDALSPLLAGAARGLWPVEARMLYDLQRVCIDSERKVHTIDVIGWLTSFGRRRIIRLLPHHQEVMLLKHLRRAAHRTPGLRISQDARKTLAALLDHAIEQGEDRLREQVRPLLLEALWKAGMIPGNYVEKIALQKLVEELLDFVVERGYLNMGDLRDAISRNNLKLPDLSELNDLVRGDLLLRSSRRLRDTLDGVYHHGEFYLRWMQRLSSLAFGTQLGRFLTLYLILPFGGSYVILHGLHHIVYLLTKFFADVEIPHTSNTSILLVGGFLFAVINFHEFRRQVIRFILQVGRLLHVLFVELPGLCFRLPIVQELLGSNAFEFVRDFIIKPMTITVVAIAFLRLYGFSARTTYGSAAAIFLVLSFLLNTFLGRHMEEAVTDALARTWRRLHLDVFPAVLRFVMDLFRQMIGGIERFLYTVDEWLRFRTGESRLSLVLKGSLGVIWFFVTYLVRIYVNLLIEPTVNPIKHFPVVTVGAKLILPFAPVIMPYLAFPFLPLGTVVANGIALINFILIPGMFGFLLWELKENWRLYEANRSTVLQPVPIGHHGETMVRLMRPGFHSGTIPKTYARLRRALRKTGPGGSWKGVRKQEESLHHIADRLRKFLEREFLALFEDCRYHDVLRLRLEHLLICTNRVVFAISNDPLPHPDLTVAIVEDSGWLTASVLSPGWLEGLAPEPAAAVRQALLGLYKLAGVELLEEDLKRLLEPSGGHFELADRQIRVWPDVGSDRSLCFHWREGELREESEGSGRTDPLAAGMAESILSFRRTPIAWKAWVQAWQEFSASPASEVPKLARESVV
jgi:hypothetical protein